jgi:hypothetical protein
MKGGIDNRALRECGSTRWRLAGLHLATRQGEQFDGVACVDRAFD